MVQRTVHCFFTLNFHTTWWWETCWKCAHRHWDHHFFDTKELVQTCSNQQPSYGLLPSSLGMSFFFVSECNFSGFKWKCSLNTNSQVGLVGTGTFQAKIYIAPKKTRDTKNRWLGWLIMKIMKPRPYLKPWNWWLPLYTSHHLWGLVIQIAVAQIPNDLSLSALVCVWLNSVF